MEAIRNLAILWVSTYYDKVDWEKCGIKRDKDAFIKLLQTDIDLCGWVILEIMNWATDTDHLAQYIVQDDPLVIKIGTEYFKYTGKDNEFKSASIKRKITLYYD